LSLLWEERRSLYAEADLRVPVDATDTSETIVARVIELVPGVLRPAPSERREN
jgi:hypothetical protein